MAPKRKNHKSKPCDTLSEKQRIRDQKDRRDVVAQPSRGIDEHLTNFSKQLLQTVRIDGRSVQDIVVGAYLAKREGEAIIRHWVAGVAGKG